MNSLGRTCFSLMCCLLLLAAVSPSTHAARHFLFHGQAHSTELQHAVGASVIGATKQSVVQSEHEAGESLHVVSRELASATPPVPHVAHTDYICADSC